MKPTIEEVKLKYANAETVECVSGCYKSSKYTINIKTIEFYKGKYYCNTDNPCSDCLLWDKDNGYAKILTYKEPKEESFLITKERLNEINQFCLMYSKESSEKLKEWFPSAFVEDKKELVLEVGKWYKSNIGTLANYNGKEKMFGISSCGTWNDAIITKTDLLSCKVDTWFDATDQEVKEALEKEAVKRYKVGDYIQSMVFDEVVKIDSSVFFEADDFEYNEYKNSFYFHGFLILEKGQWATIVPVKQMTQSDIEKELGYKIEIVN